MPSIRPPHDTIANAYDRWADVYDDSLNATQDLDAFVLRNRVSDIKGREVLELGCGTGRNTEWLVLYAKHVLGVDFSRGMLHKARTRLAEVRHVGFQELDLTGDWALPRASRDRVVSNLVLEHIKELRPLFTKVAGVLRPGGTYFLSELHPYRQLQGAQAQFVRPDTQAVEVIGAYQHDVCDFVEAGLAAGLVLQALDEWRDPGEAKTTPPRLLCMLWQRPE